VLLNHRGKNIYQQPAHQPGKSPPRPYIMPDAGSEAPGVYRGGIPGSPSLKAHRAPGSLLVHLHSGPKPPFCPMMHQATRANCPPNRPGRVLPEIKFGGVNVRRRNSVQNSAGRVLPLSDMAPASPSSADLELPRRPRAGSTMARPRAVRATSSYPQQPAGPRGQTGAPPRRPRADPQHPIPRVRSQKRRGGCISAIPYRESPPPQGLEGHQRMGTT
jgi:hypothetical protein